MNRSLYGGDVGRRHTQRERKKDNKEKERERNGMVGREKKKEMMEFFVTNVSRSVRVFVQRNDSGLGAVCGKESNLCLRPRSHTPFSIDSLAHNSNHREIENI